MGCSSYEKPCVWESLIAVSALSSVPVLRHAQRPRRRLLHVRDGEVGRREEQRPKNPRKSKEA